jgi:UDP-N-acetylglucosamine transferase subunit ALG13
MCTFVTIGNSKQQFTRLLNQLVVVKDFLPSPVTVQHGYTSFKYDNFNCTPFFNESEYIKLIKESNLIISHAGAGSFINARKYNKNLIIVPRQLKYGEHVNDHQVDFARFVEFEGLGTVIYEINNLKNSIKLALDNKDKCKLNKHLDGESMADLIGKKLSEIEVLAKIRGG